MHEAVEFDYADLDWDDEDIQQLASCLAYAHSLGGLQHVKRLNLMRNKMGDAGLMALTQVIRSGAMPKLREKGMQVLFNPASKRAQAEMKEALKDRKLSARSRVQVDP